MLDAYREDMIDRMRAHERLATIGQLAASIGHELRRAASESYAGTWDIAAELPYTVEARGEQLVISGLAVSTLLTLVVIPVVYSLVERLVPTKRVEETV